MKRIGILTSGGDAPGMNAAIRAVARVALYNGIKVSGIQRGYEGLIEGDILDMDASSVGDIIQRGGTKLRTSRSERFREDDGIKRAMEVLNVFGIEGLVVIGGDGTFRGAKRLSEMGFPTVGIPGTIDNDLGYTDHTIGFDTAINTVVEAITKIRDTSSSHGRCNIIEVMGRQCGDIALFSGISGGAETIIIPENHLDMDSVCKKILVGKNRGKLHSIIILAEGVGKPYDLAEEITKKTNVEVRVSVIGYLQRGGDPSAFDRILASRLGARAVELLMDGKKGRAIGIRGNEVIDLDFEDALAIEKKIDDGLYHLAEMLST